jgi:CheY-like chemotaxis protein
MAESGRPYSRSEFNRALLANALTQPFNVVLLALGLPDADGIDLLRKLNLPPDYLLLNRIQWGINSILGRLRAQANWQRIGREFWDGAPPATSLGAAEADHIASSAHVA